MRKIKYIIIHHSFSFWGNAGVIRHWHCDPKPQGRGWTRAGYHRVIQNQYPDYNSWATHKPKQTDGHIQLLEHERNVANGCIGANANSIHVCLIGNFDIDKPTENQISSIINFCVEYCKHLNLNPLEAVWGHGEMQKIVGKEKYRKSCPGKNFDMRLLRLAVRELAKK